MDSQARQDDNERRIDLLERSLRRWRWVSMGAVGAGVGLALALGAAGLAPERMAAPGFDVTDSNGKVRARLGVSAAGEPSLELLDAKGVAQATLALGKFERPDDQRLKLKRSEAAKLKPADEPLRAVLRLGSETTFRNPRRNDNSIIEPAIELGVGESLRVLRMRGDDGDERVELRVGQYEVSDVPETDDLVETTLRLKGQEGRFALELGVEPVSTLRPSDRRPRVKGPLFDVAAPYMVMFGEAEQPIFLVSDWSGPGGQGNQPTLDLWDGSEKPLFRVPETVDRFQDDVSALKGDVREAQSDIRKLEADVRQLQSERH